MKETQFTDMQIASILGEAESGMKALDVCRKYGISPAIYYKWKSKYGGQSPAEMKRVRALEAENAKLRRMNADLRQKNDLLRNMVADRFTCRRGDLES